jgi:hypothetical protein
MGGTCGTHGGKKNAYDRKRLRGRELYLPGTG